ncbi:hypothetical protein MKX03_019846 [Papaver bracteatum]|nr:hypothetical protein MKX03_019846 [Papaver bracteatum]
MSSDVHCLVVVNDHKSTDQLALLVFKDGITQDPFGVLNTWNDSTHYCEWRGVTCSGRHQNRVTKLDLDSQKLVGSVSPHIGNLSFLEDLILHNNGLHGEIPQQIGHLFRLKGLGLSNNSLEGEIPHNISGCSNLMHLNLTRNNLVGSVPNELGYLSNLMILTTGRLK